MKMYNLKVSRFSVVKFKIFISSDKMIDKYLEVMDFESIDYKDYLRWFLLNFKLR